MPSEEPEATTERPCPNPYGVDHAKQHCPICKGMEKVKGLIQDPMTMLL